MVNLPPRIGFSRHRGARSAATTIYATRSSAANSHPPTSYGGYAIYVKPTAKVQNK